VSASEQRALEALKDAARVVESLTSGRCHDSAAPDGTSVVTAKARLTIAATSWARHEREARNARTAAETLAARNALREVLEMTIRYRDAGKQSLTLDELDTAVWALMPKEDAR
jgi:hypothetical protein